MAVNIDVLAGRLSVAESEKTTAREENFRLTEARDALDRQLREARARGDSAEKARKLLQTRLTQVYYDLKTGE